MSIILTKTPSVAGYHIATYGTPIVKSVVIGVNSYGEWKASFREKWGGLVLFTSNRSATLEQAINEGYVVALKELADEAERQGHDAVICVETPAAQPAGKNDLMFSIVATGQPVTFVR